MEGEGLHTQEGRETHWGPWGAAASGAGVASWFLGGLAASGVGVLAAVLGFLGARRKQRLSQVGLFLGAIAALFVCLQDLGIVQRPETLTSDKAHLIRSIMASIDAHEILSRTPLDPKGKADLIAVLKKGLKEARQVRTEWIEKQVPGFSENYRDGLIQGTENLIQGFQEGDTGVSLEGGIRMEQWGWWNRENREALARIREPKPSIAAYIAAWAGM